MFKSVWTRCAYDSLLLPSSQKFEASHLGNSYVLKQRNGTVPPANPKEFVHPAVVLDYRCWVPNGVIGRTMPPRLGQCLTAMHKLSAADVMERYGLPDEESAGFLKMRATGGQPGARPAAAACRAAAGRTQRRCAGSRRRLQSRAVPPKNPTAATTTAADILQKGFEYALYKGEPRNPAPQTFKLQPSCCRLKAVNNAFRWAGRRAALSLLARHGAAAARAAARSRGLAARRRTLAAGARTTTSRTPSCPSATPSRAAPGRSRSRTRAPTTAPRRSRMCRSDVRAGAGEGRPVRGSCGGCVGGCRVSERPRERFSMCRLLAPWQHICGRSVGQGHARAGGGLPASLGLPRRGLPGSGRKRHAGIWPPRSDARRPGRCSRCITHKPTPLGCVAPVAPPWRSESRSAALCAAPCWSPGSQVEGRDCRAVIAAPRRACACIQARLATYTQTASLSAPAALLAASSASAEDDDTFPPLMQSTGCDYAREGEGYCETSLAAFKKLVTSKPANDADK
jgi:hypothetical protein